MKNVWIIVPGYNESKYVGKMLDKLLKIHKNVIFIDDGSSDNTYKLALKRASVTLRHAVNLGKGAALKTGCEYAFRKMKAEAVVIMDSDDQHDPRELKSFFKELDNGTDVVFGVRKFKADMPLLKFLGNKLSSIIVNLLCGKYFSDIPSGYKAFTHSAYRKINWSSQGYGVETEIAVKVARNKLNYVEIPIATVYHDADKGFTILDALRILVKLPKWLSNNRN